MAFVPKVHNREAPSANRHLDGRWQRDKHARHLQNIGRVKARIDNKWGQTYNGVTETKRASYPHVKANLKKAQLQDERYAEIEQENYQLLPRPPPDRNDGVAQPAPPPPRAPPPAGGGAGKRTIPIKLQARAAAAPTGGGAAADVEMRDA